MNDRFTRSCGSCLSGLKLQPLETISAGFFLAAVCWLTFASGRITLTVTSFKVFPAALWLACSWFFMLLARRQNSCCLRRRDWLWLLLTTAFLLAPWLPVLTGHPGYDGYWLLCLKFFYLSALVYLLFLLNSIKRLAAFAFLFPSLLLIASLAGILEYLGLIFVVENWEHNTVAVFFKNPNIYAAFLLVCLPVSFGCLRLQQGRVLMIFTALACLLGLFNLFLAGSRAALLALCFILLAAVVFYIRGQQQQQRKRFIKWFLLFCCVLLLLLLVFFYLNQQFFFKFINSFRIREARVLFYRTALQIWTSSPFTVICGSGPGAFFAHYSAFRPADFRLLGSDRGSQHAHNLILEILCESGVIGLLLFLAMAGLLAYYTLRLLRKLTFPPGLKPLLTGFLLALAALCCDGMFSTNLQEPPVEMLFYLTAGILWCFIRLEPGVIFCGSFWHCWHSSIFYTAERLPLRYLNRIDQKVMTREAAIDNYQEQRDYLLKIALLKEYLQRSPCNSNVMQS